MGGLVLIVSVHTHAASIIDDFSVNTTPIIINTPSAQIITLGSSSDFSVVRDLSTTTPIGSDTTSFDFAEADGSIFDTFALNLLKTIDRSGINITLTVDGLSSTQSVNTIGDLLFVPSLFGDVANVNSIKPLIYNNVAINTSSDSPGSLGRQVGAHPDADPKSTVFLLIGAGILGFAGFLARKSD